MPLLLYSRLFIRSTDNWQVDEGRWLRSAIIIYRNIDRSSSEMNQASGNTGIDLSHKLKTKGDDNLRVNIKRKGSDSIWK